MRFKILFIAWIMALSFTGIGYADIASPDHTFVQNDAFSSDFHTRINENFTELTNSVNNVDDTQMKTDTLLERSFADEINPRVRTYEGASCEFVYEGLLPATDSDLTSDISAGTGYPRGFRCNKASGTSKTYTASRWTYVDIDQNCDFQYQEQTIGGSAPAISSNSIRLARVSTDSSTINSVTDLRKTSCADGPFSAISDTSTGANLGELLQYGTPIKRSGTDGWIQGLHVSWDSHTVFSVLPGSAYINGEYRVLTETETVAQTTDDPINGISGLDTGAIAGSTTYNIFLAADQESVSDLSVTYTTASTPAGVTNYRKLGQIRTDAASSFSSWDLFSVNGIRQTEIAGGILFWNPASGVINYSYNVASVTDSGTGDFDVTWDKDFANTVYGVFFGIEENSNHGTCSVDGRTIGTTSIFCRDVAAENAKDIDGVYVLAMGER